MPHQDAVWQSLRGITVLSERPHSDDLIVTDIELAAVRRNDHLVRGATHPGGNDSLIVRTQDGLDRMTIDNYLGLIPDASTLRIVFSDGSQWFGAEVFKRISSWVVELDSSSVSTHGGPNN